MGGGSGGGADTLINESLPLGGGGAGASARKKVFFLEISINCDTLNKLLYEFNIYNFA